MTEHEIELAKALNRCSGWIGAYFIQNVAAQADLLPQTELSLRQRHYMEILAWRYRKQLPAHLIPEGKPLSLPPRARKEPRRKNLKEPDLFVRGTIDLFGVNGQST